MVKVRKEQEEDHQFKFGWHEYVYQVKLKMYSSLYCWTDGQSIPFSN